MLILNEYIKLLLTTKKVLTANRYIREIINSSELCEDAKILIRKNIDYKEKYIKEEVNKNMLGPRYKKDRIEIVVLEYLKNQKNKTGIYSSNIVWRLIKDIVMNYMTEKNFIENYQKEYNLLPPSDFYLFLDHNSEVFVRIFKERKITFGDTGYPDLILYDKNNFDDFMFVEVKDINDKLSENQLAWLHYFDKKGIRYCVFQVIKDD